MSRGCFVFEGGGDVRTRGGGGGVPGQVDRAGPRAGEPAVPPAPPPFGASVLEFSLVFVLGGFGVRWVGWGRRMLRCLLSVM